MITEAALLGAGSAGAVLLGAGPCLLSGEAALLGSRATLLGINALLLKGPGGLKPLGGDSLSVSLSLTLEVYLNPHLNPLLLLCLAVSALWLSWPCL